MGSVDRVVTRTVVRAVALYTALIAIAWCVLFPIMWALSGSLKREGEVSQPKLVPDHPQWSNYGEVFALMPFWRMFFNTVLYAGCVTAGQVFFCSLAGYAFARLHFRGRDTLFVMYLGTLMVPLTVTVIPQFILMRVLGPPPVSRRLFYLGPTPSSGRVAAWGWCCWLSFQAASYSSGESPQRPAWMRRGLY
ncbi:carbohydrate ABC transporter permease, partial [Mycobacterium ostraviense]|uniref:carbohydrate ABC transporter permease n=1 Tax=Mycobacterium ostraviense TaxID=2738409 RepID=UPI000A870F50